MERWKDGKMERRKDRKMERQRDRETERQRDRETERQRDRETERQTWNDIMALLTDNSRDVFYSPDAVFLVMRDPSLNEL
jgi:hypothetical protein